VNNGLCVVQLPSPPFTDYLFRTTDGGNTWAAVTPLSPNLGHADICSIPGTSWYASCGVAIGTYAINKISYSTDAGQTWIDWGGGGVGYTCIQFADNATGFAGLLSDPSNSGLTILKYSGVPTYANSFKNIIDCKVFPNPSLEKIEISFNLDSDTMISYSLFDALGKEVESTASEKISPGNHILEINKSGKLKSGIYNLNLEVNGQKIPKKIIIN
jgi:hypothetical protein